MAAATVERMPIELRLKNVALVLAGSVKALQGTICVADTSDGTVKPAVSGSTTLLKIGEFNETVDNSASTATTYVMVSLDQEVCVRWYNNVTGANAVVAASLFNTCYMLDNQTVTMASSGNSAAGRVWAIDASKGVAVQSTIVP